MSFVVTVISHADKLDASSLEKVKTDAKEWISITGERALSVRATDIFVDVSESAFGALDEFVRSNYKKEDGFDVILQKNSPERKDKRLFIFDMDSTLIYQEVIELIAQYADIEDKVAEITERAMNGELDFNSSLHERVKLLKGIDSTSIWEELKHKIQITNGASELCKALKKTSCVLGVCSGGFIPLAEHIKNTLGLDYAYANVLGTDEMNILDGTVVGPIVNAEKKAQLLLEIAERHNIDPRNAVAVGDGANDLKMMEVAGFGIAWNAKPKVQKVAPSRLNSKSLADILYILGYDDAEIEVLMK